MNNKVDEPFYITHLKTTINYNNSAPVTDTRCFVKVFIFQTSLYKYNTFGILCQWFASFAGAGGGMLGARLKSWMEAQLGRAKKRKQKQARQAVPPTTEPAPPPHLSSPESAYSTGYSTDGTSPGAPPAPLAAPLVSPPPPPTPPTTHLYHEPAKVTFYPNVARQIELRFLYFWANVKYFQDIFF